MKYFPDFVQSLPQVEMPYAGLQAWLVQSDQGQVVFHAADAELVVPEHLHCSQWGVVLAGRIDFLIAGERQTYNKGDSYVLPAGTPHSGHIYPGFRSVDYFDQPDHYRARQT